MLMKLTPGNHLKKIILPYRQKAPSFFYNRVCLLNYLDGNFYQLKTLQYFNSNFFTTSKYKPPIKVKFSGLKKEIRMKIDVLLL